MIDISVPVRYSDLDRYGHVSSSRYIDLVDDAIFSERPESAALRRTIGDMACNASRIAYKRPIAPVPAVRVRLAITSTQPLVVQFWVLAADDETVHATGEMGFRPAGEISAAPALEERTFVEGRGMPVLFDQPVFTRFDDISARHGLSIGRFIDFVLASRFYYFRRQLHVSVSSLTERGIGLFLTGCEVRTYALINEAEKIELTSWTGAIAEGGSGLIIPFRGHLQDGGRPCFSGRLVLTTVDLTAARPKRVAVPDWFQALLFSEANS